MYWTTALSLRPFPHPPPQGSPQGTAWGGLAARRTGLPHSTHTSVRINAANKGPRPGHHPPVLKVHHPQTVVEATRCGAVRGRCGRGVALGTRALQLGRPGAVGGKARKTVGRGALAPPGPGHIDRDRALTAFVVCIRGRWRGRCRGHRVDATSDACACTGQAFQWGPGPPPQHQATLAPHAQGPAPVHTPARARAYTQDDGIFRPPALRWGLVAVDSPLGLGTGQSGCSASWWGREGSPHPRACSCMRPPAQPNPTPPPVPPHLRPWGAANGSPKQGADIDTTTHQGLWRNH